MLHRLVRPVILWAVVFVVVACHSGQPKLNSPGPQGAMGSQLTYDPLLGGLLLDGGASLDAFGNSRASNSMWLWRNSLWHRLHGDFVRNIETQLALNVGGATLEAFDNSTGQLIVIAGNDTWTWNGKIWTESTRFVEDNHTVAPSVNYPEAMAYDTTTRQVLLITWTAESKSVGAATWSWTGTGWTRLNAPTPDLSQNTMALSFNGAIGKLLLFGATESSAVWPPHFKADLFSGQLWAWDGTSWSSRYSTSGPSAIGNAPPVFEYDRATRSMVLFECADMPPSCMTWLWRRDSWIQIHPRDEPSARIYEAATSGGPDGKVTLFGGESIDDRTVSDMWSWNGRSWIRIWN